VPTKQPLNEQEGIMKLVSVAEMQAIEKEADKSGLTYAQMMENAGRNLGETIRGAYFEDEQAGALGLVGSGNNGGDTLVALAYLADHGWQTTAYLVRPREEGDPLVQRLLERGGEVVDSQNDKKLKQLRELVQAHPVVFDGVLGTGIRLPLKTEVAAALEAVRQTIDEMDDPPYVVAVDCPSGVDLDSGEVAPECIPADMTVTMAAVKAGLLRFPAFYYVGTLHMVDIGKIDHLSAWESVNRFVADAPWVAERLPERPMDAHKGTFGTALVVAGSFNYTGAAILAGEAAYRAGAGMVTLGVPTPLHMVLAARLPEVTWVLLPHDMGVISRSAAKVVRENLERVSSLLLGPGFGLEDTTRDFLSQLLGATSAQSRTSIGFTHPAAENQPDKPPSETSLPSLVIDADGLKLLAKISGWPRQLPVMSILTPHPGEMSVLTDLPKEEIQADRIGAAERFASEWGHVVVLKGAFTVIAAPDGRTAVIPVASAALARAGTGDILAGLVAGLLAQKMESFEAAVAGAWIHAQAGLEAAELLGSEASVLAGDVLNSVADVMAELTGPLQGRFAQ
jgi:ADP-dependent NAD(P)H-hydrate dehydratase / NAD(P)H-hydrate epimerase